MYNDFIRLVFINSIVKVIIQIVTSLLLSFHVIKYVYNFYKNNNFYRSQTVF